MSILSKPYELTVWEDVWDFEEGKFKEKRLATIGSLNMKSQNKALEVSLTRNVNGTKKLIFKMYKRYTDNITGKKVDNPFTDWLVSERKVKLYYKNKWYDFFVKNIQEDSSNYLYIYELEDAIVNELSKNGFDVALDAKLMNNMGSSKELAKTVLKGTDWEISPETEVLVQKIEENLVYLKTTQKFNVKHIYDQTDDNLIQGIKEVDTILPSGSIILGFYSCCQSKPHRFQFLYLESYDKDDVRKTDARIIQEDNCQYYIQLDDLKNSYQDSESKYGFSLPKGIQLYSISDDDYNVSDDYDTTISSWYRGERYGFAQQAKYIPILDKYVKLYQTENLKTIEYDDEKVTGDYEVNSGNPNYPWNISNVTVDLTGIVTDKGQKYTFSYEFWFNSTIKHLCGEIDNDVFLEEDPINVWIYNSNGELVDKAKSYKDSIGQNANLNVDEKYRLVYSFVYSGIKSKPVEIKISPNKNLDDYIRPKMTIGNIKVEYIKEYYCDEEVEYVSPSLIQNYITNPDFKNTSGWVGTYFKKESSNRAKVENVFGYFNEKEEFITSTEDLNNDKFYENIDKHSAYMKATFEDSENSIVINSGPYDNRTLIKNMEVGSEWALRCIAICNGKECDVSDNFSLINCFYDSVTGGYSKLESNLKFEIFNITQNNQNYKIFKVISMPYTENGFKKSSNIRLVMSGNGQTFYIKEIEFFRVIYDKDGNIILPDNQTEHITEGIIDKTYKYFDSPALDDITNQDEIKYETITKELSYDTYKPVYNNEGEKILSVTASESNYFNILQSIAEQFECWLELIIVRDKYGAIQKKQVAFKNYAGKDNYACFRYGVNLKNIQRTFSSKEIVTKLYVKPNSNEFAKNGFCTIQRAAANTTGENYIYDFQYYYNTGLLNASSTLEVLYSMDLADGPDIQENYLESNAYGYYPRLRLLNEQLIEKNEVLIEISQDLLQLKSEWEVANAECEAARSGVEETAREFSLLTGTLPTDGNITAKLLERSDVNKLLNEYVVYATSKNKSSAEMNRLDVLIANLQERYSVLEKEIKVLLEHKEILNKQFYGQYYRFIQEGTWLSEEYIDDELYYADALSVLYNSCYPQVAYQINTMAIDQLPGYEHFTFELGDITYVEDPEFFGYVKDGVPYREEVVVTELIENLDDPSKSTIKVQNFKNQFQDLFQKITATVQQTQYNTGSYKKAVALAEANQERKYSFLTDALAGAESMLKTAGQQSVVWGSDGITVTDVQSPCNAIKLIGGAILLSKQDKNGQQKWTTGITHDGVSASLITAGVLNAGEISIMNNNEPVFRWDAFGISAYDYTSSGGVISGVNTGKFVRFDKYGLYGINDGTDGSIWHPDSINSINEKATFALNWDGLKITSITGSGTETTNIIAKIGKDTHNIISVKKGDEDLFKIANNGDVTIKGHVVATSGTIGGCQIIDGTLYVSNANITGTINGSKITAGTITASKIDAGAITTAKLDSKAVTAAKISVSQLSEISSNAGIMVSGELKSNNGMSINITAGTINFTNFKVSTDGTVEATNGKFIGYLESTEGKVGKWLITEEGLSTSKDSYSTSLTPSGISFGYTSSGSEPSSGSCLGSGLLNISSGKNYYSSLLPGRLIIKTSSSTSTEYGGLGIDFYDQNGHHLISFEKLSNLLGV